MQEKILHKWNNKINFEFIKRVPEADNNEYNIQKVDLSQIDCNKPILICFGGDGTITDKNANYMAKLALGLLGLSQQKLRYQIVSIKYGEGRKGFGALSPYEIKALSDTIFLPQISQNGVRLTTEQAQSNVRNINFFTYCYGANAVREIIAQTSQTMESLGYSFDEQKAILGQVLQVGYAPNSDNEFTTNFYVKSLKDEEIGFNYKKELGITDKINPYLGQGILKKFDKNGLSLFVGTLLKENDNDALKEHQTRFIERNESWETEGACSKRSNGASMCLAYALAMGLINSTQNYNEREKACKLNDVTRNKFNYKSKFTPLATIDELRKMLQITLDKQNATIYEQKEKAYYDAEMQRIQDENRVHSIEEILQENNVAESDVINGRTNLIDLINHRPVDLKSSKLGEILKCPSPYFSALCDKIYTQQEAERKHIANTVGGIILNDGNTVLRYKGDEELRQTDLKMRVSGLNLQDSVRFERNGDKLELLYNYGSKDIEFANLEELQAFWDNYDTDCDKPNINMNTAQTTSLLNVLTGYQTPLQNLDIQAGINLESKTLQDYKESETSQQRV